MHLLLITTTTDLPEAHLIAALSAKHNHRVLLLGNPKPAHAAILTAAGVAIEPLDLPGRFSLSAIRAIRSAALRHHPAIAHYFSNRALSNGLLALRGLPIRHIAYRGAIGNVSRWDPLSWATYLNPRLDRIICVSRAVEDYLASVGVARSKLRTIYKGHDLSWYDSPRAAPSSTFTERLAAYPEATVIGCTANMRPVKGVDLLLTAMQQIPPTTPLHLILIGEVRDKRLPGLIAATNAIHPVTVVGYQEDPIPYLRHCDLFVMPSRGREGLPKAAIEAMTQRVVPIVTRVGGMPELVLDQECGLVIEPNSPEQIAAAITTLSANKLRLTEWGLRARDRIAADFHTDETVRQTVEVYSEVVASREYLVAPEKPRSDEKRLFYAGFTCFLSRYLIY